MMKKLLFSALIGLTLLPGLAFADTSATSVLVTSSASVSVQQQIAMLQAQIANLLAQIKALQGGQDPTGAWCHDFNVNMGVGATGEEVSQLGMSLGFSGAASTGFSAKGYYDEGVAAAVSAFQQKYASEILYPNGLKYPTGYVGRATRAKLNALYGCGVVKPPVYGAPVISGVSGPTQLNINQTGTWSITAWDPMNGTLGYVVIWGDEQTQALGSVAQGIDPYYYAQQTTFTHSYTYPGTYKVRFIVKNQSGVKTESSMTVNVTNIIVDRFPLNVTSPNGGESWIRGSSRNITWVGGTTGVFDIRLQPYYPPCTSNMCPMYAYRAPYTIVTGVSGYSYAWTVGNAYYPGLNENNVTDGPYTVQVCEAGGSGMCDTSDASFRIDSVSYTQ